MYQVSLKAARVNAEMTLEQAAKAIGVTKMTLIKWEKGRTAPSPANFDRMCQIYHAPREFIFLPERLT